MKKLFQKHVTKHINKNFRDDLKPIDYHFANLVKDKLSTQSGAGFFDN